MSEPIVQIESLDHKGRGVAHIAGKTFFIEGALPYEQVSFQSLRNKPAYEQAVITTIHRSSFMRTHPACPHYGVCGGCSMQHVDLQAQVAAKQRVLEDSLAHIGNVKPQQVLAPITGQAWHYRHRARLSARFVEKKGGALVGFHEKHSRFIAQMETCAILPIHISKLIMPLRALIGKLSIRDRLPQVEVAVGEWVDVLVFRNMETINAADTALLKAFSDEYSIASRILQIWLQPRGPDSCHPLYPLDAPQLSYLLPTFNLSMPYYPTEFTQINPSLNVVMVDRAMRLLNPQPHERIADMFCGIGNFTLPIARSGAKAYGVEGNASLVKRANENARHNGLQDQVSYHCADLFTLTDTELATLGPFDKMLVDPPRDGAVALFKALRPHTAPKRIIYISCNPATLARDAAILVHTQGYVLKAAGMINMFPHTAHVESIAWFEKIN